MTRKMAARGLFGAALILAGMATPAGARIVEYGQDEPSVAAAAVELGLAPAATLPARSGWNIAIENPESADHETLALGIGCSAYSVENPASALLKQLLGGWDRDGTVDVGGPGTSLGIRILSASSSRRCVQVAELSMKCIYRAKFTAEASFDAPDGRRTIPVSADVQRNSDARGFCAGIARSIGLVSREAALKLIADVAAKAGNGPTGP